MRSLCVSSSFRDYRLASAFHYEAFLDSGHVWETELHDEAFTRLLHVLEHELAASVNEVGLLLADLPGVVDANKCATRRSVVELVGRLFVGDAHILDREIEIRLDRFFQKRLLSRYTAQRQLIHVLPVR